MDEIEDLDTRGLELLQRLAGDPDNDCRRQFDALYYELVWRYLRASHFVLAVRVSKYLGLGSAVAPQVLEGEVDEVAHEATTIALRRVRERAARFDPNRGTPTKWVIGAAEYAWVDVAKTIVNARRSERLVFVDPQDFDEVVSSHPSTEEYVLARLRDDEALADAASSLTSTEFAAIRLVITLGYSYAEAAERIFGDSAKTKQIDGLLTRAKAKLARAWIDRRPAHRGAKDANFSDPDADEGRSDA